MTVQTAEQRWREPIHCYDVIKRFLVTSILFRDVLFTNGDRYLCHIETIKDSSIHPNQNKVINHGLVDQENIKNVKVKM